MPHKDPEANRAYKKAWHIRHRDEVIARCQVWLETHREENKVRSKTWYEAHREEANARSRANYAANRDQRRLQNRLNHAKNPADGIARTKAWRKANPEKRLNQQARRRAQKKGAPLNDLTHAQWLEIQAAQDHRCYYCGKRCKGHMTQDHITPLSKGGSHTLHNVIGACAICNVKKNINPPPTPVQPMLLTIARAKKKRAS